jgi:uncharacterized protein (DUF927 family)
MSSMAFRIATLTGWYEEAFILPDHCIGSDKYFFQSESYNANIHYQQQGTLEEWQTNIAKYCTGCPPALFECLIPEH